MTNPEFRYPLTLEGYSSDIHLDCRLNLTRILPYSLIYDEEYINERIENSQDYSKQIKAEDLKSFDTFKLKLELFSRCTQIKMEYNKVSLSHAFIEDDENFYYDSAHSDMKGLKQKNLIMMIKGIKPSFTPRYFNQELRTN